MDKGKTAHDARVGPRVGVRVGNIESSHCRSDNFLGGGGQGALDGGLVLGVVEGYAWHPLSGLGIGCTVVCAMGGYVNGLKERGREGYERRKGKENKNQKNHQRQDKEKR